MAHGRRIAAVACVVVGLAGIFGTWIAVDISQARGPHIRNTRHLGFLPLSGGAEAATTTWNAVTAAAFATTVNRVIAVVPGTTAALAIHAGEPKTSITVKLQPGPVGIDLAGKNADEVVYVTPGRQASLQNADEVVYVTPGSQASLQGIQTGMRIVLIDGETYTRERFTQKIKGQQSYELTLVKVSTFKVGAHVEAWWAGATWYPATIASVNANRTFTVAWYNGETRNRLKNITEIRPVQPPAPTSVAVPATMAPLSTMVVSTTVSTTVALSAASTQISSPVPTPVSFAAPSKDASAGYTTLWSPTTTSLDCAGVDCTWTSTWSCPGQMRKGLRGLKDIAADDGSVGYRCCCRLAQWKSIQVTTPIPMSLSSPPLLHDGDISKMEYADVTIMNITKKTKKQEFQVEKNAVFSQDFYTCVDDKRVYVNFTNKTCITRAMLLPRIGLDERQGFYLACGAEATMRKHVQFDCLNKVTKELLELILYAWVTGIVPLLASSLVFQACNCASEKENNKTSDSSGCGECLKCLGYFGTLITLSATILLQLYTTVMTTRHVIHKMHEFTHTLNYRDGCNFALYLEYATQGQILEFLLLAMFSWSDLIFNFGRILHDTCILLKCCCCTWYNCAQYIFCCKWIPWHCLKILCCCYGPLACLQMVGSEICTILLLIVCYPFLMIAVLLVDIVSMVGLTYSLLGVALVAGVYGLFALIALFFALTAVYTLTFVCQCLAGRCQSPCDFYCGVVNRLYEDHRDAIEKLTESVQRLMGCSTYEVLPQSQNASGSPQLAICVADIDRIVSTKAYALILPFIGFGFMILLSGAAYWFTVAYTLNNVGAKEQGQLSAKVASSWQAEFGRELVSLTSPFKATNEFVYEYLVLKISHFPAMMKWVAQHLRPELLLQAVCTAVATLADLGTTFEAVRSAVFALRISNGVLTLPLRFFAMLAQYDVIPKGVVQANHHEG